MPKINHRAIHHHRSTGMPPSTPLLVTENLTKHYGKLQILNNINLQVHSGEVVAITGESGAGKSTLLHILATLASHSSELHI